MKVEITIGWTRSDMENGYSSFDGYKPGASQHVETIEIEFEEGKIFQESFPMDVAEWVFEATNAPVVVGTAERIRDAIAATGYRGQGAHYSLSTGDTVTVGEVMMECKRFGWEPVRGEVKI